MTKYYLLHKDSRRSAAAIAAVAILLPACGESVAAPGPGPPTTTTEVGIADNRFTPSANSIEVGATVTWSWGGANFHNVTFDDPTIGDSVTQADGTFESTFEEAGEFTYFCTVHGRAVMSGRVVVGG